MAKDFLDGHLLEHFPSEGHDLLDELRPETLDFEFFEALQVVLVYQRTYHGLAVTSLKVTL